MKNFLLNFLIIILTAVITTGVSYYFQRNYLSKFEENNLIRELIPSLTSNNPSQVDMALLILEKSIDESNYKVIKSIIDKKIAALAEISYSPVSKSSVPMPFSHPIKSTTKSKIVAYADQREDWKKIITKKEQDLIKPLQREDLLKLLDSIDGMVIDKTQKQINIEIAKKINKEDFFAAVVGLDWMLHFINDGRHALLKGILKNNLKSEQRELLENYFNQNGFNTVYRITKFHNLVVIDLDSNVDEEPTAGVEVDKLNLTFLKDIREDKAFQILFSTTTNHKFKSKFENVK